MRYSLVVPVYCNEASIPRLLESVRALNTTLNGELEAVFVVDGSPDRSFELLREGIATLAMPAQLLAHSRNFGSFAAIRSGLKAARGAFFGVMAADLQEPPDLMIRFFQSLAQDECDVIIGAREGRNDPWLSKVASTLFWKFYRFLVVPEMPQGGVDVFGCNTQFRDQLLRLEETRSSLVALIFWLGFRRRVVGYIRLPRREGKSAWSIAGKIDYMMDSVFAFTNLPIRLLIGVGAAGSVVSAVTGAVVLAARLAGLIDIPGYAATMLAVLFFGTLNLLGLGLVGAYAWRGYENTKRRPPAIVAVQCKNQWEPE